MIPNKKHEYDPKGKEMAMAALVALVGGDNPSYEARRSEMEQQAAANSADQDKYIEDSGDEEVKSDEDISEEETSPSNGRRRRRRRKPERTEHKSRPLMLTDEQENLLLEFYRENTLLYDKSNKGFNNKMKKDAAIESVARQLGITAVEVRRWMTSMRTIYGKLMKRKGVKYGEVPARFTSRQKWIVTSFQFLHEFMIPKNPRRKRPIRVVRKTRPPPPPVDEDEEEEEEEEEVVVNYVKRPSTSNKDKKARMQLLDFALKLNDPRIAWAHWMGTELSSLHDDLWTAFQQESFNMVMRFQQQNRHLLRQQQQQQPPPKQSYPPPNDSSSFWSNLSSHT